MWDADAGKGETVVPCTECGRAPEGRHDPGENRRLLRVLGETVEDWPEHLTPTFCCFKVDLETTLKAEIGLDLFEELLGACQAESGMLKRKYAIKNPKIIAAIIHRTRERGCESTTLNAIIDHVVQLATPVAAQVLVAVV